MRATLRCCGLLILASLAPSPAYPTTAIFGGLDCEALGLIDFGELRTVGEWQDLTKRYVATPAAPRLARIYRRASNGQVGQVQASRGTRLCYGDRLELWHEARAIVDQLAPSSHLVVKNMQVEGGAIIELGSPIRQYRGATTFSVWDGLLEEDSSALVVEVGQSGAGVASPASTFRLEVEDACVCKVRLAVSRRNDPLSDTIESDGHGVTFRWAAASEKRVERRILGGEAVSIDLSRRTASDQQVVQTLPSAEVADVQARLAEAHERLMRPLVARVREGEIRARPTPAMAVEPVQVALHIEVDGQEAPGALRVDGVAVLAPGWERSQEGWGAHLDLWLMPGVRRFEVGIGDREPALKQLPVDRTTREQTLKVEVAVAAGSVSPISTDPVPAAPTPTGEDSSSGGTTGETWTTTGIPGAPMTFIGLSGGTFKMGRPDREVGDADELPQHTVTVSGFWIGQSEVTQAQWAAVVQAAQAKRDPDCSSLNIRPSHFTGDSLPVEQVSWCDAARFANALSRLEGLSPAYEIGDGCSAGGYVAWDHEGTGFRLPTEAEWEYAARASATSSYATGDTEADLARAGWYSSNSSGVTHPVCTAAIKPWGLCDMHGNVWEWVWDWLSPYQEASMGNPIGVRRGNIRVLRGGSWASSAADARSAHRNSGLPSNALAYVGFRLVLPAKHSERPVLQVIPVEE